MGSNRKIIDVEAFPSKIEGNAESKVSQIFIVIELSKASYSY